MVQPNWFIIPISAFIPIILALIWYHPKAFGSQPTEISKEVMESAKAKWSIGQILLIYLFSFILSYFLTLISVHQIGVFQLFFMDPSLADTNSEFNLFINDFMTRFGDRHRSFGHGFLHGAEASTFMGLSILGTNALIQAKPLKGIWVHLGFWVVCCGFMAGINCTFF